MKTKEKRLKELSERLREIRSEQGKLQNEIRCEENKKMIGLIYHIPFEIRIEERPYRCLFRVESIDEFGTLIGTLIGESFDFGKYGYVMIKKHWFSVDQLGSEVNFLAWETIIDKFKTEIETMEI